MNKITCICLGVRDMERSIKFYRDGLGYKTDCTDNNPPVCFFDPDGYYWEVAWGPKFEFDENGLLKF